MITAVTRWSLVASGLAGWLPALPCDGPQVEPGSPTSAFVEVFDEHWQCMRDHYPYFELYGIDWDAERREHRPRAAAAASPTEFVWEMARLYSVLDDAHVAYVPPLDLLKSWAVPDLQVMTVGRRAYVRDWKTCRPPSVTADRARYPEILAIDGTRMSVSTQLLAAGPEGTRFSMRLRWADGSEVDHVITRRRTKELEINQRHYGERWIVAGRVGKVGYLRVRTFDPNMGTLGPAGKMTPILRARLTELLDTEGLVLDLQGNGGGAVGASDPFLSHFLTRRRSYRWGNSGGARRVLVPRLPRYESRVVAIVDEKSASGGEWAARILRDAGRAQVVGGRTMGAEAAVHTMTAGDGSKLHYSALPMVEPGVEPFQKRGVALDHEVALTIAAVREHGYERALELVRRQRFSKALEALGAPAADLEALIEMAAAADQPPSEPSGR